MARPPRRADSTFRWRSGAKGRVQEGVGHGVLNAILYAEERAKADAVVRGGHRSFATGSHLGGPLNVRDVGGKTRGKSRVGGYLRRSIYGRVTVNGRDLPGSTTVDENGESTQREGGGQIVGILGTNSGYGLWVDQGTSKMAARPMILPAIRQMIANFGSLARAGAARFLGRA